MIRALEHVGQPVQRPDCQLGLRFHTFSKLSIDTNNNNELNLMLWDMKKLHYPLRTALVFSAFNTIRYSAVC